MSEQSPKPGSTFNSIWMAVGIILGAGLGVAMKDIALGLGLGLVIGMSLAFAVPTKKP